MFAIGLPVAGQDLEPESYRPSTEATIPSYQKPTPREIVQLKAMARGEQRARRIAAQEWYGESKARYTSASTPFTAPDPSWDRPIQRPYAWYEALKRPFEQRVWGDFNLGPYVPVRAADQRPALRR
jgi:hypothetical protein